MEFAARIIWQILEFACYSEIYTALYELRLFRSVRITDPAAYAFIYIDFNPREEYISLLVVGFFAEYVIQPAADSYAASPTQEFSYRKTAAEYADRGGIISFHITGAVIRAEITVAEIVYEAGGNQVRIKTITSVRAVCIADLREKIVIDPVAIFCYRLQLV